MRWLLLFAGLLLAVPSQAARAVSGKMRDNVVMISATSVTADGDTIHEQGVGLVVGERGGTYFVVTANHVAFDESRAARTVLVRFRDDPTLSYPGTPDPRANDPNLDVAVLRVRGPARLKWNHRTLLTLETADVGMPVAYVGRSGEWYVPAIEGRISSINRGSGTILIEGLNVTPGSSGAPIAAKKRFVGIHSSYDPINQIANAIALSRVKDLVESDWAESNVAWSLESVGPRLPGLELSIGGGIQRNDLVQAALDAAGPEFSGAPRSGWYANGAARLPIRFGLYTQFELGGAIHRFDVEVEDAIAGSYRERYRETVTELSVLLKRPLPLLWGIQLWPEAGLSFAALATNQVEVQFGPTDSRRDPEGFRSFVVGSGLGAELLFPFEGFRLGVDGRATLDGFASGGDAAVSHPRTFGLSAGLRIWR